MAFLSSSWTSSLEEVPSAAFVPGSLRVASTELTSFLLLSSFVNLNRFPGEASATSHGTVFSDLFSVEAATATASSLVGCSSSLGTLGAVLSDLSSDLKSFDRNDVFTAVSAGLTLLSSTFSFSSPAGLSSEAFSAFCVTTLFSSSLTGLSSDVFSLLGVDSGLTDFDLKSLVRNGAFTAVSAGLALLSSACSFSSPAGLSSAVISASCVTTLFSSSLTGLSSDAFTLLGVDSDLTDFLFTMLFSLPLISRANSFKSISSSSLPFLNFSRAVIFAVASFSSAIASSFDLPCSLSSSSSFTPRPFIAAAILTSTDMSSSSKFS